MQGLCILFNSFHLDIELKCHAFVYTSTIDDYFSVSLKEGIDPANLPRCFKQLEGGDGHKMNEFSSMYSSTRLLKHIVTRTFPVHLTIGLAIYLQTVFPWSLFPLTSYLLSLLLFCLSLIFFLTEHHFVLYE